MTDDPKTKDLLNNLSFGTKSASESASESGKPIKVSVDNWAASGFRDLSKLLSSDNKNPVGTASKLAGQAIGAPFGKSQEVGAIAEVVGGSLANWGDELTGVRKAITEIDSASLSLGKTLGDKDYFLSIATGIEDASKATNLGVGEIVQKMGELYKTSTFMAAGFKDTDTAAERSRKEFEGLSQSVNVARAVGLSFNEMSTAQNAMFKNQAMSTSQSAEAIALLKDATTGTTLSMPNATKMIGGLAETYKYLTFNAGTATKALAGVMKSQKEMELAGTSHIFKNDAQAAETYSEALSGIKDAQQSFGQALSTAAMTGGGIDEAFDMMTGKMSQEEIMNKTMESVAHGWGRSKLMTREEAEAGGKGAKTQYIKQAEQLQQKLHLASPQQAMGLMDMSKDITKVNKEAFTNQNLITGKDAIGRTIAPQATATEGSSALGKSLATQEKHWPALLKTTEQLAPLQTNTNLIMGALGRDVTGKLIPTTMRIADALLKAGVSPELAKKIEAAYSSKGYQAAKDKGGEVAAGLIKSVGKAAGITDEEMAKHKDFIEHTAAKVGMIEDPTKLNEKYSPAIPSAAPAAPTTTAANLAPAAPAATPPSAATTTKSPTTTAANLAPAAPAATPPSAATTTKSPTTAAANLAPAAPTSAASAKAPSDDSASKATKDKSESYNIDPTKNAVLDVGGSSIARSRSHRDKSLGPLIATSSSAAQSTTPTASMGNLGAMLDQKKSAASVAKPASVTVDSTMKKDAATQAATLSASKPTAPAATTAAGSAPNNAQPQAAASQTQYVGKAEINIVVDGKKLAFAIADHLAFQPLSASEAQQKGKILGR